MDRYLITGYRQVVIDDGRQTIDDPAGWFVKYSDHVDAIGKAQIDMARCNREGDDAVIRAKSEEIAKLQSRVRELEELINEISPATWDDDRMKYVNVQVSRETYDQILALKGGA